MNQKTKKVVILGAGFAGVYAYLELLKHDLKCDCLEVLVVNDTDYFSFVVLAHEVATGSLMPHNIIQPINSLPRDHDTFFIEGKVIEIDLDNKDIKIKSRKDIRSGEIEIIDFDYLISALGSESNDFKINGVSQFSLPLKNLNDAKKIKNKILESFEKAQYIKEEKQKRELLTFVIIGGGATGVELAGEISDFVNTEMKRVYPKLHKKVEIILIEAGQKLVPLMGDWFDKKAKTILRKKKVQVMTGQRVTEITENCIFFSGSECVLSRNVFWTAGIKARDIKITSKKGLEKDEKTERIKVKANLELENYKNVYIAGDQAFVMNRDKNIPYPMRAQFAVRQGILAARNIIRNNHGKNQKEFYFKDKGFILSLGKGGALAKIFGIKFSGVLAWFIYRGAYLSKLVGIKAKLRTGLEWVISLFFSRDISKL